MKNYRALIVEDSIDVRRALKAALELMLHDFEVADVPSAEEGLLEFFRQPVDLLVTDFRLPGMTGFELLERMRIKNPALKVILITGMPDPEYRTQALAGGADAFFYKPLDMIEFTGKVRELFGLEEAPARPEPHPPSQPETIGDWLAAQRLATQAQAVLLLESGGRAVAQAGEYLPYDPEAAFVPELLSMAANSVRLARFLEQEQPGNLLEVRGARVTWLVAPLGTGFMLLYILPAAAGGRAAAQHGKAILAALPGLAVLLNRLEAARPKTGPLAPLPPEVLPEPSAAEAHPLPTVDPIEQDADLAALVASTDPESYDQEDLQAFWEKLEQEELTRPTGTADVLTYEEARRLGLAPDDE
jgi:DNA-binding response OmpR family regulator